MNKQKHGARNQDRSGTLQAFNNPAYLVHRKDDKMVKSICFDLIRSIHWKINVLSACFF